MVAIKSLTESVHDLSITSDGFYLFAEIKTKRKKNILNMIDLMCAQITSRQFVVVVFTSLVLGLGVFGIVDVTVVGVVAAGGAGVFCTATGSGFCAFCGRSAILKLFSLRRPFVLKCIANGD